MSRDDFTQRVIAWNIQYPIDYWWRSKYKVAFGSVKHRSINFFDVLFELEEYVLYNEPTSLSNESIYTEYKITGQWIDYAYINTVEVDDVEVDNLYNNLDLSQFDDD